MAAHVCGATNLRVFRDRYVSEAALAGLCACSVINALGANLSFPVNGLLPGTGPRAG
jgi:hypothetical protein